MELKLTKEEAMFVYSALENSQIKGALAAKVVAIFEKLNGYIIAMQENEDRMAVAQKTGVDPVKLVKD